MAAKPAYDLLVLIDADIPEERRAQVLDTVRKQVASGDGELKGDVDWGVRKLAFEIAHRGDAYYHLFQLEAGPEILKQLEHNLAIDDAVLRHRIIRLPKGVPDTPPRPTPSAPRTAPAPDEPGAPRPAQPPAAENGAAAPPPEESPSPEPAADS